MVPAKYTEGQCLIRQIPSEMSNSICEQLGMEASVAL